MKINLMGEPENYEELSKKLNWLEETVQKSLLNVRGKKIRFKRKASIVKILTITSSAILTLLLGLQFPEPISSNKEIHLIIRMLAFFLGIVVTLLNALEPFFNLRALWIEHEEANYKFHVLKRDIQFIKESGEEIKEKDIIELKNRMDSIWRDLSEKWLSF